MKKLSRVVLAVLALTLTAAMFSSCSKEVESTPVAPQDFRITTYLLGKTVMEDDFDASHLEQITDIIFFGYADFDESGDLVLDDNFVPALSKLQSLINDPSKRIYLNVLGPDSQSESDNWNEKMQDKADRHSKAFKSGKLESNIKTVLDEYKFDGIFFDYEFPIKGKNWKVYNEFIVSLDKTLGDSYKIGAALAGWDAKFSKESRDILDMIEIMSYDLWDDDGNHATMDIAKEDVEKFIKKGYDMSKLDLGVPFYARPTNGDEYWYNYKDFADKIDKNGIAYDDETKHEVSFNTPELIAEKTEYAMDKGLGGMMIWHYGCDLPANDDRSLFNAMYNTVSQEVEHAAK